MAVFIMLGLVSQDRKGYSLKSLVWLVFSEGYRKMFGWVGMFRGAFKNFGLIGLIRGNIYQLM